MTTQPQTAPENDHNGPRWMTVSWHPDAIERATEHATALIRGDYPISDTSIHGLPLTWQDVAVLRDIANHVKSLHAEVELLNGRLTALQPYRIGARVRVGKCPGTVVEHPIRVRIRFDGPPTVPAADFDPQFVHGLDEVTG